MTAARFLPLSLAALPAALVALAGTAHAQTQPQQPLPPLPSQAPQYAPPPPPPQNGPYYSPPPTYGAQPYYQQQPQYAQPAPYYQPYYAPPPPPVMYVERPAEPPVHAPRFSLWTGARLGYMGFGGGFYGLTSANGNETTETTGNLVTPGPQLQVDVGVRLGRRYVPFVFYERDFLQPGRRFAGDQATAYSDFYGIGFRYTAGDVNSAGFLSELSIGYRNVSITDNGQTYTMTAFELFRLGLGAEIRLSTLFVLSPLISISTGYMSDTSGSVTFSKQGQQIDGQPGPPFANGAEITDQRGYVTISIGCGAHFDLLGK